MPLEQVTCSICQCQYEDSDSALVLECDECRQPPIDDLVTQIFDTSRYFFWPQDGVQAANVTTATVTAGNTVYSTTPIANYRGSIWANLIDTEDIPF